MAQFTPRNLSPVAETQGKRTMGFLYSRNEEEITVTGFDGPVSWLQVPEELEGLPVRRIAKSAFARRPELVYVSLPENLQVLERFAFYACPALKRVDLGGGITDYYDGVFRQCGSLREFGMNLSRGQYTVLRDLLAEHDRTLRVQLRLPGGEVRLTFPEYFMEYEEDTWARAFHSRFEGSGYAFRECVGRDGIDLRGYDRAFGRIRRTDIALGIQIALDRLCLPCGLEEGAGEEYGQFLREHAEEAVRQAVSSREENWLRLLLERKLLTPDAVQAGLREASRHGQTDFVALLMNAAPAPAGAKRFRL